MILDSQVLVIVEIQPESRVKVMQGSAPPELVQGGTRAFLVKVINQAASPRRSASVAPTAVRCPSRHGDGMRRIRSVTLLQRS
jgi:hypothetical protein